MSKVFSGIFTTLLLISAIFYSPKVIYASENISAYTVQTGDTLWGIAERFLNDGNKWHMLVSINSLNNPQIIHKGNIIYFNGLFNKDVEAETGVNLLANGDFEAGNYNSTAYWSDNDLKENIWYLTVENGKNRKSEKTELRGAPTFRTGYGIESIDGETCGSFCDTSVIQIVPAEEAQTYKLTADGYIVDAQSATLYLDFLNQDKVWIGVYTMGGFKKGVWTTSSVIGKAPAKTKYIRVILYTANAVTGTVYWDNAKLERLP